MNYSTKDICEKLKEKGYDLSQRTFYYYAYDVQLFGELPKGRSVFTEDILDKTEKVMLFKQNTNMSLDEIKKILADNVLCKTKLNEIYSNANNISKYLKSSSSITENTPRHATSQIVNDNANNFNVSCCLNNADNNITGKSVSNIQRQDEDFSHNMFNRGHFDNINMFKPWDGSFVDTTTTSNIPENIGQTTNYLEDNKNIQNTYIISNDVSIVYNDNIDKAYILRIAHFIEKMNKFITKDIKVNDINKIQKINSFFYENKFMFNEKFFLYNTDNNIMSTYKEFINRNYNEVFIFNGDKDIYNQILKIIKE